MNSNRCRHSSESEEIVKQDEKACTRCRDYGQCASVKVTASCNVGVASVVDRLRNVENSSTMNVAGSLLTYHLRG